MHIRFREAYFVKPWPGSLYTKVRAIRPGTITRMTNALACPCGACWMSCGRFCTNFGRLVLTALNLNLTWLEVSENLSRAENGLGRSARVAVNQTVETVQVIHGLNWLTCDWRLLVRLLMGR